MNKIKTLILPVILFLSTLSCLGQGRNTHPNSIGFQLTQNFSYRTLSSSLITDLRNEMEGGIAGYSGDFIFQHKLKRNVQLETGLQLNRRGFRNKKVDIDPIFSDPIIPETTKSVHSYYFSSIPMKINFIQQYRRLGFHASCGISANLLLFQQSRITDFYSDRTEHFTTSSTTALQRFTLSANLGAGMTYALQNSASLRVQAGFQHDILSIIEGPQKCYLWDLGLNVGYIYRL